MAKYNSSNFKIEFDNSGGVLVDMSAYVTDAGEMDREMPTEDTTPFSVAVETNASAGVEVHSSDISLKGFYDDTASTGPDVIFNAIGSTRTLKYTYGSTKTTTVETIITDYKRTPKVKGLTGYEVTLKKTGAVVEA